MAGRSFAELCELTVQELHDVVLGWNDQSTLAQPKVNTDAVVRSSLENEKPIAGSDSDSSQRVSYGVSAQNFALAAEQKSQYIASEPMRQVESRLRYLIAAGLHYVALSRPLHTLSSGEAQRVVMTTLLGSSLVDMLYVFDEPTVGLHPGDTERMADAILGLRDRGNTVILIEHEPHLMRMADQIIEIGPDAGSAGGNLVFQGTPQEILAGQSLTGAYLNGSASTVRSRRPLDGRYLELRGASGRNLKSINCRIPLGCLTVVIGPSGAGKSTLVLDTLCPAVLSQLEDSPNESLPYESVLGTEQLSGCLSIDQSPIPRSIRSCPATYCKAMDDIRQVFSETSDAVSRGLGAGHFSFNNETGRCPTCQGLGYTTIDMQFMADLHLPCTDCDGKRFRPEVLEVRYRDQNIADVLSMSLSDAHAFFRGCHSLQQRLKPMLELGLGYLPLGQSLSDLSAGESMRLKLASHLEGRSSGTSRTEHGKLIVMDEPTTGLHFQDIDRLIRCVDVLIDQGNTVVVIEHNQQIISNADHIIELGPGAGDQGGTVIATGTAIELKTNPHSVTGRYL
jgi:excinuclease ABC subunit A